jgi:hypothetical protein
LKTRPDWRKIKKEPEYHISANLVKGIEENYRWLGVDWPANRYLLISLSGDADIKSRKPMQTSVVHSWSCRYDLQTGKFDVPALFSDHNAKAVVPEWVGLLIVAKADWERIHAKDAEALLGQSGPLLAQMRSARRPFYFRYSVKSGSETDIPDWCGRLRQ